MLRVFFERIIEWEWTDASIRNPIIGRDIPPRPEPLPKFLDDRDAAKLMAAANASSDPRDRLIMEILSRTGMRASEVCGLDPDAVLCIGDNHWLRVPVGKLRNDRYVPLHPNLVVLLSSWTATNLDQIRRDRRLVVDQRGPFDRHLVSRVVRRVARKAGIKAHPHQLRHTLATQAKLMDVHPAQNMTLVAYPGLSPIDPETPDVRWVRADSETGGQRSFSALAVQSLAEVPVSIPVWRSQTAAGTPGWDSSLSCLSAVRVVRPQ